MRFKLKPKPTLFDRRIIKKFAWFPIEIDREVRWLEKVVIEQKYYGTANGWISYRFIDEE